MRSQLAGEARRARRRRRCATTRRPTRSRRCRSWCTSTPRSAATRISASRPATETPIGRDAITPRRLRSRRCRQALRQGFVARAQRRRGAIGGRAPGDRRELRAHLSPERRQRRTVHLDRFRPHRAHRRGEAIDLDELLAGRDALAASDPAPRRPAQVRARATARRGNKTRPGPSARHPAATRCSRRSLTATRRDPRHAVPDCAPAKRLRARRLALHPRVLHGHVRAIRNEPVAKKKKQTHTHTHTHPQHTHTRIARPGALRSGTSATSPACHRSGPPARIARSRRKAPPARRHRSRNAGGPCPRRRD